MDTLAQSYRVNKLTLYQSTDRFLKPELVVMNCLYLIVDVLLWTGTAQHRQKLKDAFSHLLHANSIRHNHFDTFTTNDTINRTEI